MIHANKSIKTSNINTQTGGIKKTNEKDTNLIFKRIQSIANKIYKNHKNSIYMLLNDLDELAEINQKSDINSMTTEDFSKYIKSIRE
jgi:hypothetical protein